MTNSCHQKRQVFLESYHRDLAVSRAQSIPFLEYMLDNVERHNWIGKTEGLLCGPEDVARNLKISEDKSWMTDIVLQGLTMMDFFPDPAAERAFAGVLHSLMEA